MKVESRHNVFKTDCLASDKTWHPNPEHFQCIPNTALSTATPHSFHKTTPQLEETTTSSIISPNLPTLSQSSLKTTTQSAVPTASGINSPKLPTPPQSPLKTTSKLDETTKSSPRTPSQPDTTTVTAAPTAADVHNCATNPCKHGTCQDGLNDYSCTCEAGWEGEKCDKGTADPAEREVQRKRNPVISIQ